MKSNSHAGRERPRGGCPDDCENFHVGERRIKRSRIAVERVLHPHGRAGMVFVLNLSFGKGGLVVNTPIDRAQALVDESLLQEFVESSDHNRLVFRRHGRVRTIKASEYSDTLELLALQVQKFFRIAAAFQPNVDRFHFELFSAQHLVNFQLDGQAVTVPSWNVRRVHSRHGLGFDDEILQALVECVSQVNSTIGVRRTIVQHVGGCSFAPFANAFVDANFLPARQNAGLFLRQVGLHRKVGPRQIKGFLQIERHSRRFSQMVDFFQYNGAKKQRPTTGNTGLKYWTSGNFKSTVDGQQKRVQFSSKVTFFASKVLKWGSRLRITFWLWPGYKRRRSLGLTGYKATWHDMCSSLTEENWFFVPAE